MPSAHAQPLALQFHSDVLGSVSLHGPAREQLPPDSVDDRADRLQAYYFGGHLAFAFFRLDAGRFATWPAQRALLATFAASLRCFAVILAARASPPFLPAAVTFSVTRTGFSIPPNLPCVARLGLTSVASYG